MIITNFRHDNIILIYYYIPQLELDNREHFLGVLNRYEACFSQLLASVASAFVATLCFRGDDPVGSPRKSFYCRSNSSLLTLFS